MKKYTYTYSLTVVFICMFGINAYAQNEWSFTTALSTNDKSNIEAGVTAGTWYYSSEKARYSYLGALSYEALTANGAELEITKGLLFTNTVQTSADTEGFLRLESGRRMWLSGSGTRIIIPGLKKGQNVTVSFASSSSSDERTFIPDNMVNTSGFVLSANSTTQTGTGTIETDGNVILTPTGALYVYSISVSEAPGLETEAATEGSTRTDVSENAVAKSLKYNQIEVQLNNNDIKYYNTADLAKVSIEKETGTVSIVPSSGTADSYYASVKHIGFAKAAEQGISGKITNGSVEITNAMGWQESAYMEWKLSGDASSYNVYVKGEEDADYSKIDWQLVRNYRTYGRADAVGLRYGTYSMKIEAVDKDNNTIGTASEATNITVTNYDRTGYAHFGRSEGIGAYNNDGTLKKDAVVLYITDNNINTIQCDVTTSTSSSETRTGLGNILQAFEKGYETRPFAIRFIGEIKIGDTDAGQLMGDKSCLNLKGKTYGSEQNVTFEGIGDDATLNGIGMRFSRAGSVEIRNLGIMNHADDCFELTQSLRMWIHNVDMYYGNPGSDSDQEKGDGSIDLKKGTTHCTFSYNHFWDSGKASLCGLSSETTSDYVTYHHNWFDHSDSRHPRVRVKTIHAYNNYYDGVSKYGAGSTTGSSLFIEANYFRNTKFPMMVSLQGNDVYAGSSTYNPGSYATFSNEAGGMIKSYNNIITGETSSYWPYAATTILTKGAMVSASSLGIDTSVHFDAYEAASRDEQVPNDVISYSGGNSYNNFDTDSSLIYEYIPDTPANVPAKVEGFYGAGRLNHGDLVWDFNDDTDDTSYAVDTTLKSMLTGYATTLIGIFGDGDGNEPVTDNGTTDIGDNEYTSGSGDNTGTSITASVECNFENGEPSDTGFTVTNGNYSTSRGTALVNGTTYTTALKIESTTEISFTTEGTMSMTLVLGSTKSSHIKVDGTEYIGTTADDGCHTVTIENLGAGTHIITKSSNGEAALFYIGLSVTE